MLMVPRLKRLPSAAKSLFALPVTYALCKCFVELFVVGIFESFGQRSNRYAVRISKPIKPAAPLTDAFIA